MKEKMILKNKREDERNILLINDNHTNRYNTNLKY